MCQCANWLRYHPHGNWHIGTLLIGTLFIGILSKLFNYGKEIKWHSHNQKLCKKDGGHQSL